MKAEPEVIGPETEIVRIDQGAIGAIVKSETEAQLDAAHRYARSIKTFLDEATTLATFSPEIAASCIYGLPRDGKIITGPSVRLAEMCASAYGNLHVGARVVGIEEKEVVAQGICWDIQKNLRVTIEKRRRITTKEGRRFKDDMITLTGNAAASIALRDAIFRVIPRAYVNSVYEAAKKVAVGDASTLVDKRQRVMDGLTKMGITKERILLRLEKKGVDDIGLGELETLIGLANAIMSKDIEIDEAFPVMTVATKGTVDLESLKAGKEENRGHGAENLQNVNQAQQETNPPEKPKEPEAKADAPKPAQKAQEPPAGPDPEAPVTQDQFTVLDDLKLEKDVDQKDVLTFVKTKLGYKMYGHLKQKDYERVKKFIENGGKE